MDAVQQKPLLGKVVIAGKMYCETGLHIGAQGGSAEIGGMDNPVVRDPITRQPYVPGSSLKGKLRALLERAHDLEFNHPGAQGIYRHECRDTRCPVCRLMGSSGMETGRSAAPIPARVLVRDLRLTEDSVRKLSEIDTGLLYTEWKVENNLDRITSAANPRSMERVPAGAEFGFEIIYSVDVSSSAEIAEDLTNLLRAIELLEDDALGGSGSRGYGKVRFEFERFEGRRLEYYAGQREARMELQVADRNWAEHTRIIARYFAQ